MIQARLFVTRVLSFSTDNEFADHFDELIKKSGYRNRSRFIRDASLFFSEMQQRGDLANMDSNEIVEGHLVVYYQHIPGDGQKVLDLRHSKLIEVTSYTHSCLSHSHACVDLLQIKGSAGNIRSEIEKLQNSPHIEKVSIVTAPMRIS